MPLTQTQARFPLIAAALATAVAALVLGIAPLYESGQTLIEANGAGIGWVIVLPLAIALLPLLAPARRRHAATWTAAVVLLLLCFFSSAGIFFLPAALLLLLAAYGGRATRPRRSHGGPGS